MKYNSNAFISIPIFCLCRDASNNGRGLFLDLDGAEGDVQVIAKGSNTFNSNDGDGIYSYIDDSMNLFIDVEEGGSVQSCGNLDDDIDTENCGASATAAFTGSGYTCDKIYESSNEGTVVRPDCQPCPDP